MSPNGEEFFEEADCPVSLEQGKPDDSVQEVEKAKYHMSRFFSDKRLYTGGSINKKFLFRPNRVEMVMKMTLSDGVDRAYGALGDCQDGQEVRTVIETLSLLARSGVPQQYAGGMLCVYLELVEGRPFEP